MDNSTMGRHLAHYPDERPRRLYLTLVVVITIALYYALYIGGGVAPLLLASLRLPFNEFVYIIAFGNLVGAFASLAAGLADRLGRSNLVIYGLLLVGLLITFVMPNVTTSTEWAVAFFAVSCVEGIILVATPALIRDFSPQMGRATAMGFWTIGPVLGSLTVSAVTALTLPITKTWQSAYEICGATVLVIFIITYFFLKELSPQLRDQRMVSLRDRVLIELRAKGLDISESLHRPWRQMMHADILISALGVSVLLLFYYTSVTFSLIYFVTVFHYSVHQANVLANWNWGVNAIALVIAGLLSDRFRVRKPFMIFGGIGAFIVIYFFLRLSGTPASFETLAFLVAAQSFFIGFAYVSWMASYTETIEARNPALTATGLAIWGWVLRVVVTVSFLGFPLLVRSVNPLLTAPDVIAAYQHALATHVAPAPALLQALAGIKAAAAAAPAEWANWFWICEAGIVFFLFSVFLMRGRWSPASARADEAEHDARVAAELAFLQSLPAK